MNKTISFIFIFALIIGISSCKEQPLERKDVRSKVQVKVTQVVEGSIPDYLSLAGKTIYLNKSQIAAPIGGYLTVVSVHTGDRVKKGQLLFQMQSPEAYLTQQKTGHSKNYGYREVLSPTTGIITSLNVVHQGVFIDKGAQMCVIIDSKDLQIQAELPVEYKGFVKLGANCHVILPDSSVFMGVFSKVLPEINEQSQTENVLLDLKDVGFLPENMRLKVMVTKGIERKSQLMPRNCLQTDALMTQFWVMKLQDDSTAIRVYVTPGNQNHDFVEVLSPKFNAHDRILSQGSYGLGEKALVEVVK